MFEISFGELLVIGAVALVVLGPERLPVVARTLGALVGRAQRFVASVKADIHQQSQMAGLHELQQDVQQAAEAFRSQVEREVADARQVAQDIAYSVEPVQQAVQETVADVQQAVHDDADDDHRIAPADMLAAAGITSAESVAKDDGQLDLFAQPAQPAPDAPTPVAASPAESRH